MKAASGKTETVKVAVRVRPTNALEKKNNSTTCVVVDKSNNQISVIKEDTKEEKSFQFDYVYAPGSSQRQLYDEIAFPLVESVFEGYNGTIFAYGQTGCGKTFTMMGEPSKEEMRGVIPNAFSHIFGYIANEGGTRKFLVRCSFIEIYNEEIIDLLGADNLKKMEVREDPKTGIFVKDLKIMQVKNSGEIENCLNLGNKNRHVGETTMNSESSRSHCIFSVYVEIGENMEDIKNKKIKAGKLNLVDLAGSERQSKTGATGNRLDEAKKINLSLTALSNVINSLVENKQHVPYRDSKLTRLLQDSLGGNTKTVMIAAVSPSSFNYEETVGTLRYAARANAIKNAPKVNEDPKDTLLKQYEEEIKRLRDQLTAAPGGVSSSLQVRSNNNNNNNKNGRHEDEDEEAIRQIEIDKQLLNEEKNKIESYLKEKDQLLANTNLEKDKLLQKIQEMEKEMQKKLINGGDEKDEKEKKKFKELREKQIKIKEEVRKKKEVIEDKRKNEEDVLQNDINKLRNKIKYLESEIIDLRYENERDREDIVETVKELTKESKLYHSILKMILSDNEIKKIIEVSKWKEDNNEWRIHPFSFREKKLQLPNLRPHQLPEFLDNEINSRELLIEEHLKSTNRTNKFMGGNKDNMRETKQTLLKRDNPNQAKNTRYDDTTPDLFNIKNPQKNSSTNLNSYQNKNIQLDPMKKGVPPNITNINQNMIVINRKEAKKYEDLLKNSHNINYELAGVNNGNSNSNSNQTYPVNKVKVGKVILDPINSNPYNQSKNHFFNGGSSNKKIEVSFKATMQFTDQNGNNNKIEISPNINLHNPNIVNVNNHNNKKVRLGKIPESRFTNTNNDDLEFDDQE